ncbi:unnamed protein product [Amoebophrya sp. A25]|nr:unnamed protein product [Amoebophrya sp. A25]|eukprot:GSA25T00009004001.1
MNRQVFPLICTRDMALDAKRCEAMLKRLEMIRTQGHVIVTVPEHRLSLENKAVELATPSVSNVALEDSSEDDSGSSSESDVDDEDNARKEPEKSLPDPDKLAASEILHKVLAFCSRFGRDVLDESDEILSPKYQLIYTIGDRRDMDGGQLRWTALAAAMRSVANHAFKLRDKYGNEAVEVNADEVLFFPGFRLLESERAAEVFEDIRNLVVGDILNDQKDLIFQRIRPQLLPVEKKVWRSAVLERAPTKTLPAHMTPEILAAQTANFSKELWPWEQLNQTMRSLALVLRGVLSHEVLQVVLQKRWRVDYGAHPGRQTYQMAVPFRAKDVASDRTEFGHPDIAVLLTIAHYYQSGLSKAQLGDVFSCLEERITESEAKALYREWAESCPAKHLYLMGNAAAAGGGGGGGGGLGSGTVEAAQDHQLLPPSGSPLPVSGDGTTATTTATQQTNLMKFESVNLSDVEMFENNLFPAFSKHMDVVNFWLFRMILPTQAKQFPQKVVSTPWDLCRQPEHIYSTTDSKGSSGTSSNTYHLNRAVTTGFSGTDDLQYVLPLTIKQKNLPSLEMTNGIQLRNLLRGENDYYHWLREDNTALEILDILEYGETLEHQHSAVGEGALGVAPRSSLGVSSGPQFLGDTTTTPVVRIDQAEKVNVVLDPGALVLQLSNLEFSKEWLKRRPDMEACVFFDEQNVIKVIDRDHLDEDPASFALSPYAEDMSKCLLYLDDVHTRGSDFRLPLHTRAILTLGKGMTKDKFLQACMRMRQIGHGQKISFVASKEVHRALQRHEAATSSSSSSLIFKDELGGDAWQTPLRGPKKHVQLLGKTTSNTRTTGAPSAPTAPTESALSSLRFVPVICSWTLANTRKRICDLIPYFSAQGRQNINKMETYRMFYADGDDGLDMTEQVYNEDTTRAEDTSPNNREQNIHGSPAAADDDEPKTSVDAQQTEVKLPAAKHLKIDLLQTAEQCVEDEVLDLAEMYGHARQLASLPTVVSEQLKTLVYKLRKLRLAAVRAGLKKEADESKDRNEEDDEEEDEEEDVPDEEVGGDEEDCSEKVDPSSSTSTSGGGKENQDQTDDNAEINTASSDKKGVVDEDRLLIEHIENEIATNAMLLRIQDHVARIAPQVERFGSLFDEEQERELEQELEEERQVERPGPATAQRAHLPDALIKFVKTDGEVTGGLLSLGEALRDAPSYYRSVAGQFANFLDPEQALANNTGSSGSQEQQSFKITSVDNVYVTEDFVRTIRGKHNADAHLKNPGWIFVSDLEKHKAHGVEEQVVSTTGDAADDRGSAHRTLNKVFLLVSNFEAERCACLISSSINFPSIDDHKLDDGTNVIDGYNRKEPTGAEEKVKTGGAGGGREFNRLRFCPRLYQFAPIVRLHQPQPFLRRTSYELHAPIALHVFAGSIHADRRLLEKTKNYLALLPRPNEEEEGAAVVALWDALFEEESLIERDGFIFPENRVPVVTRMAKELAEYYSSRATHAKAADAALRSLLLSPFRGKSPVRFLKSFYNNARHLDDELAMSSVGRLLGAAELGGQARNEDILMVAHDTKKKKNALEFMLIETESGGSW